MSASRESITLILDELAAIREETETVQPLLSKLKNDEPDSIQLRAVAATLHAFYTGIERVLILVAKNIDQHVPDSPHWHRELLSQMCRSSENRPKILSPDLATLLADYLAFRHVFRHSYSDQFRWALMQPLAGGMTKTLESLRAHLRESLGA